MKSRTEPAITGPRELRDPRSREYAIQTMRSLKRFLESKTFDAKHVADELKLIEQYKHWEACGFKDIDAYIRAEVGISLKQLKARLAQDLAADPDVPPLREKSGRPVAGSNVANGHINALSSNSAERIVRRLKRDHPGIAEALARGEFRSARAAALAAGIIKPPTPLEQIQKLWARLNPAERKAHLEWTLKQCATCGREGVWMTENVYGNLVDFPQGSWCDACCEEGMAASK